MKEVNFMRALMLGISRIPGVRVWRQQVGTVAIAGSDADGGEKRFFHAGVPKGAADLSGIVLGGRRLEIEVKGPKGRRTIEQQHWAEFIRAYGGIYILAEYDPGLSDDGNVRAIVDRVRDFLTASRG
jgi:hypothetical protein